MKTATGVCKYCGQVIALQVPEEFTQDIIDEEATKHCECPEAKAITRQQETIASAEGTIRDFFEDKEGMEPIRMLLLSAVEPLAKNEIDSISISRNGYTGSMKPGKNGIKVSLKHTTVDSVES